MVGDREQRLAAGMNGFRAKPVDVGAKGVARTLGAAALGDLAAGLEDAARQGLPTLIAGRLATLEGELDRVLVGLNRLEGAPATPTPGTPSRDHGTLIRDLDRLLEDHDTAAVERVAALARAMAGTAHAALTNEIGRAITCYDFARARGGLGELARSFAPPGDGNDSE